MRILIFDTETSGLDPQWNVILQLSYQIVDSDSWAIHKVLRTNGAEDLVIVCREYCFIPDAR